MNTIIITLALLAIVVGIALILAQKRTRDEAPEKELVAKVTIPPSPAPVKKGDIVSYTFAGEQVLGRVVQRVGNKIHLYRISPPGYRHRVYRRVHEVRPN